jgi:hypothetical protein
MGFNSEFKGLRVHWTTEPFPVHSFEMLCTTQHHITENQNSQFHSCEDLKPCQGVPPHLICFTEHHLKDYELANTRIPNYTLGAN